MVCMLGVIPDTDYLIELYEDMNICLASFTKKDFLIFFSNYNTITDMLIHEMVEQEKCLNDKDLAKLSNTLDIPLEKLQALMIVAKDKLYNMLTERIVINDSFN